MPGPTPGGRSRDLVVPTVVPSLRQRLVIRWSATTREVQKRRSAPNAAMSYTAELLSAPLSHTFLMEAAVPSVAQTSDCPTNCAYPKNALLPALTKGSKPLVEEQST